MGCILTEVFNKAVKKTTDNSILINDDCLNAFKLLKDASVHCIITDPPYFIDGMGDDWDNNKLQDKTKKAGVIGALPVGMKFDPRQGIRFQAFMEDVSKEAFRVLKPGGFFISFSQARLYHRMGIAIEDAGFEIRDMLGWIYEGQAKAFSQTHFVSKSNKYTDEQKESILLALNGRKTPQLKPCIEPMALAQKPKDGTFVENWIKHETGLIDVTQSLDGKFPGNIIPVPKPSKDEKGIGNTHLTVKPVRLIEHLIKVFTKENQVILDPFSGSGTHGVAALKSNRKFIGFEIEKEYYDISNSRLSKVGAL